jgi:hypothetical protein
MTVIFNSFRFRNDGDIRVHVGLEAPIGSNVFPTPTIDVAPNSNATVPPFSVQNTSSLKLTVTYDDDPTTDTESVNFSDAANPYAVFIDSFSARWVTIGGLSGELSLAFGSR